MRVWLNPDKLTDYHLTVDDVIAALQAYNVEVSAGQFGGAPAVKGQRLNASIIVQNLLKTPEEFAAIPDSHQSGRLRRADQGRGTDGTGDRVLRYRGLLQRQARPPAWPSGRRPAPTRWTPPMPSRRNWRR